MESPPSSSLVKLEALGFTPVAGAPLPQPLQKPPFTLKQIRDAIPPHCFHRSLPRSMAHLAFDLFAVFTLYYASTFIPLLPLLLQLPLFLVYFYLEGLFLSALMIIGHECGHGAFSRHPKINNVMGWLAHSTILFPYTLFKAYHRWHHKFANTCDYDELFVRPTRTQALIEEKKSGVTTLTSHWSHALQIIPGYDMAQAMGSSVNFYIERMAGVKSRLKEFEGKMLFRFTVNSAIYAPHYAAYKVPLMMSYLGCFLTLGGHFTHAFYLGWISYVLHMVIPMTIMFFIFSVSTWLQHTDTFVPRYRDPEWTFLRGALATVDRSFGPIPDFVIHHGTDTHVVHHLFPDMPFYHAVEATKAIKGVLGPYYLRDETPIWQAVLRVHQNCKFMEDEGAVVFCKRDLVG